MKRLLLVVVVFAIATFFMIENKQEEKMEGREKRAIFISYLELDDYINLKDIETSKKNVDTMISNLKDNKFNMIILHVRPFSDAIYPSNIYPLSHVVTDNEGDTYSFDLLEYFIEKGHAADIEIHAWINPYRIRHGTDISNISIKNPAYKYIGTTNVKLIEDNGIYYNPASEEVQDLIIDGIKEIINKYDIDGIHFDDYFYPDDTIDLVNYENYLNTGGTLNIQEYRLNIISKFIKKVYEIIKKENSKVEFGISPEGNISNNYNRNYLDVKKMLSEEGYIDYIMPQLYYGFENEAKPFVSTLNEWNSLIKIEKIELILALALYKSGKYDYYAKAGANEWINDNDIIKRQILISREISHYKGFCLFNYNYLFNDKYLNENLDEERKNILVLTRANI